MEPDAPARLQVQNLACASGSADRALGSVGRRVNFRLRAWWRRALARADVAGPATLVFLMRQGIQLDQSTRNRSTKDLLEERDAPSTAGPGAAAFGELARHFWRIDAHIILE